MSAPLDRLRGAVLLSALVIAPILSSEAFLTYTHLKEAALCTGFCLVACCVLLRRRFTVSGLFVFTPLWLWIIYTFVIHRLTGNAAVPSETTYTLARYALVLLGGALAFDLFQQETWRQRLIHAYVLSAGLVAVQGLLQHSGFLPAWFPQEGPGAQPMAAVFGNTDLFGGYLAPAMAIAASRILRGQSIRNAAGWLCVLLFLGTMVILSGCRSAWMAGAVGIFLAIALHHDRRRATWVLAGVGITLTIALLADGPHMTERSLSALRMESAGVRARLWFWDGTLRMIADHPFIGVGPGQYAFHSPKYLGEALHAPGGQHHFHNTVHTLYAHSTPLELLAEGGAIGALLLGWMILRLLKARGSEWAPLAVWGVFALFNFPHAIAPHAWLAVLFMTALLARTSLQPLPCTRSALGIPLAVLCLSAYVVYTGPWMGYHLRQADRLEAVRDPAALDAYQYILGMPLAQARADRHYAIALMGQKRYAEAEEAFRKALEGFDTADIHLALGWLAQHRKDPTTAREHIEACLYRTPGEVRAYQLLLEITPPERRAEVIAQAQTWLNPEEIALLKQ